RRKSASSASGVSAACAALDPVSGGVGVEGLWAATTAVAALMSRNRSVVWRRRMPSGLAPGPQTRQGDPSPMGEGPPVTTHTPGLQNSDAVAGRVLLGVVELREVAGQEGLGLQLHLADALAAHAPASSQLLEGARLVLGEALLKDVPAQVTDALAHAGEGLAHVLVLLPAQEDLLRIGAVVFEPIQEGGLPLLIERSVQREVGHAAPLGLTAAHLAAVVLEVAGDVRADPPHGIGGEAHVLLGVEVLDGLHEPHVPLLNEGSQAGAPVGELRRHRDHEGEVRASELLARSFVSLAREPTQLVLLFTGQLLMSSERTEVDRETFSLAIGRRRGRHLEVLSRVSCRRTPLGRSSRENVSPAFVTFFAGGAPRVGGRRRDAIRLWASGGPALQHPASEKIFGG